MVKISNTRIDLEAARLDQATLKDYGETLVGGAAGTNSGSSYDVDLSAGNVFNLILTANCTFTFSNPAAAGNATSFTLILQQDSTGSRTATWPSAVKWPGGTAPTLTTTAGRYDILTFTTLDAGSSWLSAPAGQNFRGPSLFTWGSDGNGKLGVSTSSVNKSSPVQVGVRPGWIEVAAGSNFSQAIKTDGTLWGWGSDRAFGEDTAVQRSSPVQIGTLTNWAKVSASSHVLALKTDGTLWAWGSSGSALGLGDTVSRSSPVQVGTLATWAKITAGSSFSVAIKTDGTLWAWGDGGSGKLGLGDTVNRSSPVQVGTLTTWAQIAAKGQHTLAIKTDGTLWGWGRNSSGQLGLGNTAYRSSPVQVGTLATWAKVAVDSHSLAVKTDGTLWVWGLNSLGQLGLGDSTSAYRSSPVQVGTLADWSQVVAVTNSSAAIKTNGTLWTWGQSHFQTGRLGLNDTIDRSSPTQVGSDAPWTKGDGNGHFMFIR